MYVPSAFRVDDGPALRRLIEQHSFATLVSRVDGRIEASHVPLMLDPDDGPSGTLLGHLARANPQWHGFGEDQEALVIFQGPHAYISPRWYRNAPAVPTWNYTAVHVYGRPEPVDERSAVAGILDRLVARHDPAMPQPWSEHAPADFRERMMGAIQAFRMPVTRMEGKFKLSQNRPAEDRENVWRTLARSDSGADRALWRFARDAGVIAEPE